ncbi:MULTISPECIES: PA2779 family protein [Alteromonadaceae]|jgi:tRNA U34 5-carboxymethylaminomethyl modifying GTPase MnmE/TrmE|uniref:PA2779 family protein n=1 Tax=Brumicola blandensis TaxID=3075611 RepID=A0AAW8QYU3_9ALTE|nr:MULTISPECIES: PA2779 family protein [unclassified Alteromonas]MDT0581050.1 PA2779 family protein [Alteromonas sp. W409]MDT0629523.1 PA2779 family protein [Alteromonas sp. W364]
MKYLTKLLCAAASSFILFTAGAQAEVVSSDSVMQAQHASYNKQQLLDMVNRTDVESELESLGVDKNDAIARINALTDNEIALLNQELNEAPAGGIVGAVLTVFAVIAILDLVGVTDVFPFIRPINS